MKLRAFIFIVAMLPILAGCNHYGIVTDHGSRLISTMNISFSTSIQQSTAPLSASLGMENPEARLLSSAVPSSALFTPDFYCFQNRGDLSVGNEDDPNVYPLEFHVASDPTSAKPKILTFSGNSGIASDLVAVGALPENITEMVFYTGWQRLYRDENHNGRNDFPEDFEADGGFRFQEIYTAVPSHHYVNELHNVTHIFFLPRSRFPSSVFLSLYNQTRPATPVDDPAFASSFPYRDGPDTPFVNGLTGEQIGYLVTIMRKYKDDLLSTGNYQSIVIVPFDGLRNASSASASLAISLDQRDLAYYEWIYPRKEGGGKVTRSELNDYHSLRAPSPEFGYSVQQWEIYYKSGNNYILLDEWNFNKIGGTREVFVKLPFLADKTSTSGPYVFETKLVTP